MRWPGVLAVLLLCADTVAAQSTPGADKNDKGTYLGVLFSPIPDAVLDQLPQLPRNQGVLVTHVLPDSPAARAKLRRNDILLQYGDQKIRDCEHLAQLIQADKPNREVKLLLMRGGRETTVSVTLTLDLGMRIALGNRVAQANQEVPRGVAKPGTNAAVSVAATPIAQDKMKVAIEYYLDGTGRLRTITCEGTPDVIDGEVRKLPQRERALVQTALERIRALTSQKDVKKPVTIGNP
jgi:PDZ domain